MGAELAHISDDITIDLTATEDHITDSFGTQATNFENIGTVRTGSGNDVINAGTGSVGTVQTGGGDDVINLGNGTDVDN